MKKNLALTRTAVHCCFLATLLPVLLLFGTVVHASSDYHISFPNDRIVTCDPSVVDTVKPTITCKMLSVGLFQTGLAVLWATDFLESTSDNCTPSDEISLALSIPEEERTTFPLDYTTKTPVISVRFTGCELGPNVVQLWARDKAGNVSFCNSVILVQDQFGNIDCFNRRISGIVETEDKKRIAGVSFGIGDVPPQDVNIEYPLFSKSDSGGYFLNYSNYNWSSTVSVIPTLNEDPLNGVTTLDLAYISKHILNLQPLNSPYKMLAADANRSGTITSLDIVALRRLILGISDTFVNNKSWRFVPKSYVFPNPVNPFEGPDIVPEYAKHQRWGASPIYFIGIKVGDVNNSVKVNFFGTPAEDRSNDPVSLLVATNQMLVAGEAYEVHFRSIDQLTALQFTLAYPDLDLLEVIPGNGMESEHFAVFSEKKMMTCAWNILGRKPEAPQFSLRFRATRTGKMSDMLQLNEQITPILSWKEFFSNPQTLDLRFPTEHFEDTTRHLILYQNIPNPFRTATSIGFVLPESDQATLTILDAVGKVMYRTSDSFSSGYHTFSVSGASFPASGVFFYRVETSREVKTSRLEWIR